MTLGAAHAENGEFEAAVEAAERASQIFAAGPPRAGSNLPALLQDQIARYRAGKPVRTN
jgi:hypothetical protein